MPDASLIFFVAMLALIWLLLVQPQRRRRRQHQQLLTELKTGDKVMTVGGLIGSVREIGDNHVVLEIAPETSVRLVKTAVTARSEPEQEEAETPETSLP